ncbi:MAG: LuxR C-terminal-related transcriptional regulator [Acidimicrobiales bacterium]
MDATRTTGRTPVRLALVDDYEVVLRGLAHMLAAFPDQVEVVEIEANDPVTVDVDIALYDTFAQSEVDRDGIDTVLANRHARRVVVYTWAFAPHLIELALEKGAAGYLSKTLSAAELVDALLTIHGGQVVISPDPVRARTIAGHDWPGRAQGLTERESEVIALITQGHSNGEIAELMYLSPSSIKMYVRSSYRKMNVSSRTQAVLWGLRNGFEAPAHRVDQWR